MSTEEMSGTRGGVVLSNFNTPVNSQIFTTDNHKLEFDAIAAPTGWNVIAVERNYDGAKEGVLLLPVTGQDQNGNNLASQRGRVTWPLGNETADLSLTYCDGILLQECDKVPIGTNTITNVHFNKSTARVTKVWFHNTTSGAGGETASKTLTQMKLWLDNEDWSYNSATDSVDAIYEGCASPKISQFRYHNYDVQTVNQSSVRLRINNSGDGNFPANSQATVYSSAFVNSGFKAIIDSLDPPHPTTGERKYLHVFFVKHLQVDYNNNGVFDDPPAVTPFNSNDPNTYTDRYIDGVADRSTGINMVILRDTMNDYQTASVLAHEFGHAVGYLAHLSAANTLCSSPFIGSRNVMCPDVGAGRKVNEASHGQCSDMFLNIAAPKIVDHH
jgi:hypothetical protein